MRATRKQPTERATEVGDGDCQSHAIKSLVPLVPHTQIEHHSREKPAFCQAQKEAGGEEPTETLGETCEGADNTPSESECRKPESWRREPEDDIAWNLGKDSRNEAGRQHRKELVSGLFDLW